MKCLMPNGAAMLMRWPFTYPTGRCNSPPEYMRAWRKANAERLKALAAARVRTPEQMERKRAADRDYQKRNGARLDISPSLTTDCPRHELKRL